MLQEEEVEEEADKWDVTHVGSLAICHGIVLRILEDKEKHK